MHRRFATVLLAAGLVLGLGAAAPAPVLAQEDLRATRRKKPLLNDRAKKAVDGALRWLADHQNKDGSWTSRVGFKINDGYRPQPETQPREGRPHLGVTALAGMAFLSGGHLPGQGPYGKVMDKALRFVLRSVKPDGFITEHGTRMYSHAFSVLFLAEIYGMTGNPALRGKLDQAVAFTWKSQNTRGGWRYAPAAQDSDMSITVCQVVALREARNIGIKVPKESIDKALRYVMESAVTTGHDRGAFLYQHQKVPFNRNSFALTAAGLTTIYQAGLYSNTAVARFCRKHSIPRPPRISDCLRYIQRQYEGIWIEYHDHYFYFYGNYYAAQAMYTRGGRTWENWYTMVRDDLLSIARSRTRRDGRRHTYWVSSHVGNAFSTAVSAIILQVPTNYLPIFQR